MQSELSDFKNYFSLGDKGAYLNCAAHGPLSMPASKAVMQGLRDKENPRIMADMAYGSDRANRCRDAVSKLIDFPADNIALANSTSWGINILTRGIKFKSGDEVVVFEGQFPSNVVPWEPLKEQGVKLVKVPCTDFIASLDSLKEHLSSRTRIVSLEWVHFVSGDRIPLKGITALCHKKNILVAVDVTQGLGAIPYSMSDMGVDATICSGYKWLLSPYGSGFFALSDHLMDKMGSCDVNWLCLDSVNQGRLTNYEFDLCHTARRFDVYSHMGFLNVDGMNASVEWLNTLDINKNFNNVRKLNEQIISELNPKYFRALNKGPSDRQSLISSFHCPDIQLDNLRLALMSEGFCVTLRNQAMRVAPNIYNDAGEISEFTRLTNKLAAL